MVMFRENKADLYRRIVQYLGDNGLQVTAKSSLGSSDFKSIVDLNDRELLDYYGALIILASNPHELMDMDIIHDEIDLVESMINTKDSL